MMGRSSSTIAFVAASLLALGCRGSRPSSAPPARAPEPVAAEARRDVHAENANARALLCADIGEEACVAACADDAAWRPYVECLVDYRFGSDPDAAALAKRFFARTGIVPGVETMASIEGFRGESVALYPALPLGDDRKHLEWLTTSFDTYDAWLAALSARAERPVAFQARPAALLFYRTGEPAFPSAYVLASKIAYNLDGPLHTNAEDVHATLFHELFHVNDARHGAWSESALAPIFDGVVKKCGTDHECLAPFAPYPSVVAEGTFYAFDERTRDVREYAAELALRYYRESADVLGGRASSDPPFKCLTDENRAAWDLLTREFFGGVDLSGECP